MGRAYLHRGAVLQAGHGGAFVEAHAALQGHPAQAAHQFARLHGGGGRREPALQVPCRTGQALHLLQRQAAERVDALVLQRGDHRVGGTDLGCVGGRVQRAVQAEVAVDAIGRAEHPDVCNAALRLTHQPHRLRPEQAFG